MVFTAGKRRGLLGELDTLGESPKRWLDKHCTCRKKLIAVIILDDCWKN